MKEVHKFTINSDNNILAKTITDIFKVSLNGTLLCRMYILPSVKSTETYYSLTFLTIF